MEDHHHHHHHHHQNQASQWATVVMIFSILLMIYGFLSTGNGVSIFSTASGAADSEYLGSQSILMGVGNLIVGILGTIAAYKRDVPHVMRHTRVLTAWAITYVVWTGIDCVVAMSKHDCNYEAEFKGECTNNGGGMLVFGLIAMVFFSVICGACVWCSRSLLRAVQEEVMGRNEGGVQLQTFSSVYSPMAVDNTGTPVLILSPDQMQGMPPQMTQGAPMQMQPQGTPMQMQPQGTPMQMQPQGNPMQMQPQGTPMQMQPQGAPMQMQPQGTPMQMPPQGYASPYNSAPIPSAFPPQGMYSYPQPVQNTAAVQPPQQIYGSVPDPSYFQPQQMTGVPPQP